MGRHVAVSLAVVLFLSLSLQPARTNDIEDEDVVTDTSLQFNYDPPLHSPDAIMPANTDTMETVPPAAETTTAQVPRKTLSDLVNEQTEAIKKILAAHKLPEMDLPVLPSPSSTTRRPVAVATESSAISAQETIETLKRKCQHYQLLQKQQEAALNALKPLANQPHYYQYGVNNHRKSPPATNQQQYLQKVGQKTKRPGDFYVYHSGDNSYRGTTTDMQSDASRIYYTTVAPPVTTTTARATTTPSAQAQYTLSPQAAQQLNYLKMEPVVLQRTMLSNGNTLYYWYRPLKNVLANTNPLANELERYATANIKPVNYRNHYPQPEKVAPPPTTTTTTTTTTEMTPTYEIDYGTPQPYQTQYRLVLPYGSPNAYQHQTPSYDPYAHYSGQAPAGAMPAYWPTFHVIRTHGGNGNSNQYVTVNDDSS